MKKRNTHVQLVRFLVRSHRQSHVGILYLYYVTLSVPFIGGIYLTIPTWLTLIIVIRLLRNLTPHNISPRHSDPCFHRGFAVVADHYHSRHHAVLNHRFSCAMASVACFNLLASSCKGYDVVYQPRERCTGRKRPRCLGLKQRTTIDGH